MAEITSANTISALTHVYTKASTSPAKARTRDGASWVVKLRGAGPGLIGLLTEFVALRAAKGMGLDVPETRPVYVPPDFPWMLGTDEFDGIVQRSSGWNLGVTFIELAVPAAPDEVLVNCDHIVLERVAQVDRALANTDRSARNTNILSTDAAFIAIDFDACLFLRRAARGMVPDAFALWPDHLLLGLSCTLPPPTLPADVLIDAIGEAPAEWIEAAGLSRPALTSGLVAYATAWNALRLA
jgi:hypothetical protein